MADTALLPTSMATASKGMAGYVRPTLAQETYYRYYPAAATVRRMDEAVQRAEANPYVNKANALTAEVNRIRAEQEARIARLSKLQAAQLQAQAKIDQASLKAAGAAARGGRGVRFKDLVEAYKVYGEMGADEAKAFEARLKESNIGDRLNQLSTYGKMNAQPSSIQGAFGLLANQLANKAATGMTEAQVKLALRGDADSSRAFAALQNSEDMVQRASAARALTKVLENRGVSDAGTFAANLLRVSPTMTTAEGEAKVVNDLAVQAQQLVEAGRGEAGTIPRAEQGLYDLIQQNIGAMVAPGGDRGAALAATKKQIAGRQLSPEEQAALDIYLQALRDDGLVTPEDMVGIAGEPRRRITQAEIDAGKAAWEKARKNKSYRPQDAQWFDDEYLAQQRKLSAQTSLERTAREKAIGRAERTPEEIQQDMATEFVKGAIAARGLEVYIPPDQVDSPFQAQALGGALHILRREGNDVMSLDANPEDRSRRLGGTGPLAKTPIRVALKTFEQMPKENGVVSPEDAKQGIAMLRKRFKRDPEKMMLAVQYFMAMDMNAQNKATAPMGSGSTEPVEAPPVTPPPDTAPPPPAVPDRARGAGVPDDAAMRAGGITRGAPPRPTPAPQQSVQGVGADILSSVLGSQRRTDYGQSIPPSADVGESPLAEPLPPQDSSYSPEQFASDQFASRAQAEMRKPLGSLYRPQAGSYAGQRPVEQSFAGFSEAEDAPYQVPSPNTSPTAFYEGVQYAAVPKVPAPNLSADAFYEGVQYAAVPRVPAPNLPADALYESVRQPEPVRYLPDQIPVDPSYEGFYDAAQMASVPLLQGRIAERPPGTPRTNVIIPAPNVTADTLNLRGGVIPASDAYTLQGQVIPVADTLTLGGGVIPVAEASYTGGSPMYGVNNGNQQTRKVERDMALRMLGY